MHSGTLGSGSIKVGEDAELAPDYERRALVASNHTTTHLMTWALRKVLAGHSIDQRGSICGPDKLRFDFSYSKPMTATEVGEVQDLVRSIISQSCPLQKKEVPLGDAKQIKSLRAVFGEVYPDPVRVVSVGPVPHTIDELVAKPDNDDWMKLSVEFCGGTHLDDAKEATHFCCISEEGTAKGVRRMVGLTKEAALLAIMAADDFDKRVAAAATITDMAALESEVSKLRSALDATVMDYYRKDCLKQAVDGLKEKVLAAEKEALKAKIAAATTWAESVDVSAKFVVLAVDVDGDVKGLDAAMKVVNTKAPLGLLPPPPPRTAPHSPHFLRSSTCTTV
jgi:alanyl-tRNA synthetase